MTRNKFSLLSLLRDCQETTTRSPRDRRGHDLALRVSLPRNGWVPLAPPA